MSIPVNPFGRGPLAEVLNAGWEAVARAADGGPKTIDNYVKMIEDLGAAEARVKTDYVGRYPMELVQNAHDACADAGVTGGTAWVIVTDYSLIVANGGAAFDRDRVEALLRLGASSKQHDGAGAGHHTIGYKGIGFSSVFEVTDRPQVIGADETCRWAFDRERVLNELEITLGVRPKRVPIRYFPFPLADESWDDDRETVERCFADGAVTVIRLPYRAGIDASAVAADVRRTMVPEVLLFVPNLEGLTIEVNGRSAAWTRSAGPEVAGGRLATLSDGSAERAWLIRRSSIAVDRQTLLDLNDDLWTGVETLNVAVGVPWAVDRPDPDRGPTALHVYFPTDERLGRSVLVHGDFYVSSNRKRIETEGPGGAISRAVAAEAARILADLSVELSGFGADLLGCLAQREAPAGFGEVIGAEVIAALRNTPFLRSQHASTPLRPAQARRVAPECEVGVREVLVQCLPPAPLTAAVRDDVGAGALLLAELECEEIPVWQIAKTLDATSATASYEQVLSAIASWVNGVLASPGGFASGGGHAIGQRPIIQDLQGRWRSGEEVWVGSAELPPLPSWVERPMFDPPMDEHHAALVNLVRAQPLAANAVLKDIFDGLDSGVELSADDHAATLVFIERMLDMYPSALDDWAKHCGALRVPARSVTGDEVSWVEGSSVYLTAPWTGSDRLERLYGPFGAPEFLAIDPTETIDGTRISLRTLQLIGVADRPRMLMHRRGRDFFVEDSALIARWEASVGDVAAPCSDVAHIDRWGRSAEVIDRLDALLEGSAGQIAALVEVLSESADPLGSPTIIRCNHGYHRGAKPERAVTGVQEWLIVGQPWLPVSGDPLGRTHLAPSAAWFGFGGATAVLCLPRSAVEIADPARFGLIDVASPPAAAAEAALRDLQVAAPILEDADDAVVTTAQYLAQRVGAGDTGDRVPLPGYLGARRAWVTDPVIADVPGLSNFGNLEWIEASTIRDRVARERFRRASEVCEVKVDIEGIREDEGFDDGFRAILVAIGTAKGGNSRALASRMRNLRVYIGDAITMAISFDGQTIEEEVGFHNDRIRDASGRVVGHKVYMRSPDATAEQELAAEISALLAVDYETARLARLEPEEICLRLGVSTVETEQARDLVRDARETRRTSAITVQAAAVDIGDSEQLEGGDEADVGLRSESAVGIVRGGPSEGRRASETGGRTTPPNTATKSQTSANERRPAKARQKDDDAERAAFRLVSSVSPGGGGAAGTAAIADREVDARGVRAVLDYELANGRVPEEQDHGNPGFDVISTTADGSVRYIEVKSVSGKWDRTQVGLSRRQYEENLSRGDAFWLYVVDGAGVDEEPVVHPIMNPVAQITTFGFDSGWRAVVEAE